MATTAIALLTPGNNSGVTGVGVVTLDGTNLSVDVSASGLTPNQVHSLHLHGFLDDRPERLAVAADDLDGDGFIETPEGESLAYGSVIAALTASGEAQQGLEVSPDFPVADAAGALRFSQNYRLDPAEADDAAILARVTARLDGRVLEFHGLDLPAGPGAGTPNEVDGLAGYDPQVPVAQGQLIVLPELEGLPGTLAALAGSAIADFATRALAQLAPYTLNPAGTGPVAPEPAPRVDAPEATTFFSLLQPSNGSGALGYAVATFDETAGTVRVQLEASGLEPGVEHPLHIHGFSDDRPSLLPNYRLDADGDGFVEDPEGEVVVASVLLALTEDGTVSSAAVGVNFPQADAGGVLSLDQTYRFDLANPAQAAILQELRDRFTGRELQIHGLTVPATEGEGTAGEVNGTAGYKDNLPVANGILLPLDLSAPGTASRLYDAAFDRAPDLPGLLYQTAQLATLPATQVAAGFLASAEGQARFGGANDAAFVDQVYQSALNRSAEAEGLSFWTSLLSDGASRADVLFAISESAEHRALLPDTAVLDQASRFLLGA